jgi:hypothetical protein
MHRSPAVGRGVKARRTARAGAGRLRVRGVRARGVGGGARGLLTARHPPSNAYASHCYRAPPRHRIVPWRRGGDRPPPPPHVEFVCEPLGLHSNILIPRHRVITPGRLHSIIDNRPRPPFIRLSRPIASLPGPMQVGGLLAMCSSLVYCELGAMLPSAGDTDAPPPQCLSAPVRRTTFVAPRGRCESHPSPWRP